MAGLQHPVSPARLHLVDGTFELFRAHYSKRPDRVAAGVDVKATVGLIDSLIGLLRDPAEAVTHLAIAFDNPIVSFRNDLFAGYKTDEGMDPSLRAQFDPVEEAARALGVVVWSMDRYEADDALATGARRWREEVEQVRILTPDKDLGQSVMGRKVVQVDRIRRREIDEEAVIAARGVPPRSVPDLLALTGDTADGIPGLDGFGARTAAALLSVFGRIEAIPDDPRRWPAGIRGADRLAACLSEHREDAMLYRRLATLIEDVPLEESLDDLRWRGAPRDTFLAWCDRMGATDLRERPPHWRE